MITYQTEKTTESKAGLTSAQVALLKGMIVQPAGDETEIDHSAKQATVVASLQSELMNLGFMLDRRAFSALVNQPQRVIVDYYNEIIPFLRSRMSADRSYRAFYVNFPEQVMEMSHFELYLNAMIHYWSLGTWEPEQQLKERGFAFENVHFKEIRLGTITDFLQIFTKLVSINQSITEQDKAIVEWFIANRRDQLVLPAVVPFKETLCILASRGLDVPVKTPTDVLRIAVHMSGGDISLSGVPKVTIKDVGPGRKEWFLNNIRQGQELAREKCKFKKFSRVDRRRILSFLEKTLVNIDAGVSEMQRHLGRWLRLGEILHVGEYGNIFPQSAHAFAQLRNQNKDFKVRTFAGRVDMAFRLGWRTGVDLLATRPGEFARRFDWMIRNANEEQLPILLQKFETEVGAGVSTKVLLEMYGHFEGRDKETPRKVMIKKGGKTKVLKALAPLNNVVVERVLDTIVQTLARSFSKLPPLGNVWIDERLAKVPIPFAMRGVNTSVKTYIRGTRIPFRDEAKVIRPFLHWFDVEGRTDMDLSAGFFTEEGRPISHISYTNLKQEILNSCHSGDVRWRQGPCAEYVDIDIETCVKRGVRYVTIQAFNFDGSPMHAVKDCVFGLMEREFPEANPTFVPKTISNCMKIANEGNSVMICIIDLQEREYIWTDVESTRSLPNLENTKGATTSVLDAVLGCTRMTVKDLLEIHADSRGTLVQNKDEATTIFDWESLVTDYAKIAAYM